MEFLVDRDQEIPVHSESVDDDGHILSWGSIIRALRIASLGNALTCISLA